MAQQQFSHEIQVSLHETGMLSDLRLKFLQLIDLLTHLTEKIGNRLCGIASQSVHEGVSGFSLELNSGNACPVLSTVVLLLHEEIQFVQAIQCRTLLLLVIGKRLQEPDECQTAFVFDGITHKAG